MTCRAPACLLLPAALVLGSCTEAGSPLSPEPRPSERPLQALECTATITDQRVQCASPPPAGGAAGDIIVGGQNVFVRLASSNVAAADGRMSFDVTIQNLTPQPLGTRDGRSVDLAGVRVFFQQEPSAAPTGVATVGNPDGEGSFSGTAQPFFQYDQILPQGATSTPRTWVLQYSAGVERITFTVYVSAAVPSEQNWVDLAPKRLFLLPGDTGTVQATLRDYVGRPVAGSFTWESGDTTMVRIDPSGLVSASRLGVTYVTARSGGAEASIPVIVVTRETAVRADVYPDSLVLEMGQIGQLGVRTYNLRGESLDDYAIWADGNIWVAVVDGTGRVRGTYTGRTSVMAAYQWAQDSAFIIVKPGPETTWKAVTTGSSYSCGISSALRAYCWGRNTAGNLGIGMYNQYGENVPVAVMGNSMYSHISSGLSVTCALASGPALCWGDGYYGQLGNGSTMSQEPVTTPVAVIGGHRFQALDAGHEHVCAINLEGAAWCWGNNTYRQLGNDLIDTFNPQGPMAVSGGLTFKRISAGRDFTCAIATSDELYCWGANSLGKLGNGGMEPALNVATPVKVAGGHLWRSVSAGDQHACGVTTTGAAYCWGVDVAGSLGIGTVGDTVDVPTRVASGETFKEVGVGFTHSCAVTVGGAAWCWGYDEDGQLGRGNRDSRQPNPVPAPVIGGVRFAGPIEGGGNHTCAIGADQKAYCWGRDFDGEAGIQPDFELCYVPGGRANCHSRPRQVANPAPGGGRVGPEVEW